MTLNPILTSSFLYDKKRSISSFFSPCSLSLSSARKVATRAGSFAILMSNTNAECFGNPRIDAFWIKDKTWYPRIWCTYTVHLLNKIELTFKIRVFFFYKIDVHLVIGWKHHVVTKYKSTLKKDNQINKCFESKRTIYCTSPLINGQS